MNELRWILIVASVLGLAWIYWQGRRKRFVTADAERSVVRDPEPPELDEPVTLNRESPAILAREPHIAELPEVRATPLSGPLSADAALSTSALERLTITQPLHTPISANTAAIDERPPPRPAPKPAVTIATSRTNRKVIVLRVPANAERFSGARLQNTFSNHGLRHGRYGIYHRSDPSGGTLFSVASIVEPGTFDLATMAHTEYPGVALFLQLPGSFDGLIAFEAMLACAQSIQQEFQAGLQGERGKPLTPESIARLREDIANFQHLMPPVSGG